MNDVVIDKELRKKIIQGTHKCFNRKEREKLTRSATIKCIVEMIKQGIRENEDL